MNIPSQVAARPEAPATPAMADVQGGADLRNIAIDYVGIKNIRHPLIIEDQSGAQHTVAWCSMYVQLPACYKGAHMSRFVDLLNRQGSISVATFDRLLVEMSARLESPGGKIELNFPYFVRKTAPVSGARSLLDYQVTLSGEIHHGACDSALEVVVPVTSLCPCSKQISDYGAHSQRSHVRVEVRASEGIYIEALIKLVESHASAELYGLLKRADEKFITERAYDNPKFVEDMARDIAGALNRDARITRYCVSVENFESIHNHSAYAQISRDKTAA